MDPITGIGLVAALLQLAGLGIKGVLQWIRLLKDLKETPAKLTELLNDTENAILRVVELEDMLQSPTSALAKLLTQQQLTSLWNTIADVRRATDALRLDLEPLYGHLQTSTLSTPRSGVRKLWKSVVGLAKERIIQEHLRKIQRYNNELTKQL
ncbi:hypothetical protein B0H65DRAFT_109092 [Neurospora tetraspora]|uniref:Fungal N-terminal domain-containing protein n=1 Tax=Neurospora tetraspora TaxID=94610 RepID=A0AAE0JLF3_9PEZI|nr:hypothetical protein B0H65DRAFT_109092 [Neurospora tetraspora]